MNDRAEAKTAAIRVIREAFDGVRREGGISLHQAQVLDDYGSEEQLKKAAALDRDKKWSDVPSKDIEGHTSTLSFVDPIGFRYYIAAYMVWSLENYEASDSFSVDHTIYSLNPSTKADIRAHQMERFSLLTQAQAHAISSFLRYMAAHSDGRADDGAANEALYDYWERRETADS